MTKRMGKHKKRLNKKEDSSFSPALSILDAMLILGELIEGSPLEVSATFNEDGGGPIKVTTQITKESLEGVLVKALNEVNKEHDEVFPKEELEEVLSKEELEEALSRKISCQVLFYLIKCQFVNMEDPKNPIIFWDEVEEWLKE